MELLSYNKTYWSAVVVFVKPTSISIDEASNKKVACSCFIFDKKIEIPMITALYRRKKIIFFFRLHN
ncbi:MAG: hypothetical protein EAZ58_13170 [Flavobacterium sp.]|nr:MAG: hypothetical protein EAZ58_13170 [Flavobacterium sp.]